MYEDITYESILKRLMERVPADMDKREGSVIFYALAPAAAELQKMYIESDWMLNQVFADTSDREYLIKRCQEYGITPNPAVKARLKGEFNIDIEVGSRFSSGSLNYTTVRRVSAGFYEMECETPGAVGNENFGSLIPIFYIPGLTKAALTGVITEGAEEESTEALRNRFLTRARMPSTSGNRYDYYNWAMECEGVGAVKVFPLGNGPGTVKVVIADANMSAADTVLIGKVRDHIEVLRPVGADVTVASVVEKAVNVSARIRLRAGMNLGIVQNAFKEELTDYLYKEALDMSYVSLARVGNLLLGTDGVEDHAGLLLNGTTGNVILQEEEIAMTGAVTLEVM